MKISKLLIYVFATIGFGYVLFVAFVSYGPIPLCEISDIRVAISPGKQHVARLVVEQCRDKTEPKVQLNISSNSNPNQIRSVVLGIATTTDIDLTWLSGIKLQVSYPSTYQLEQQPSEIDGIEILFVSKSVR